MNQVQKLQKYLEIIQIYEKGKKQFKGRRTRNSHKEYRERISNLFARNVWQTDGLQIDRKEFLADICFSGFIRNEACTIEDIKNILQFYKDTNEFIYRPIKKDQYPTIATFIFNSKTNEINIYSYYDKSLIKYNFYEVREILNF